MKIIIYIACILFFSSCSGKADGLKKETNIMENRKDLEYIVLAGGCFWCTEAVFQDLRGVVTVESGYIGGKTVNPDYRQVCTGSTGHAEALKIGFDPKIISLEDLFEVFFATHDPTTLNRQGADVGTQYRSGIFYSNEEQKNKAQEFIKKLESEKAFDNKIVTEITKADIFYKAEDYHQNYYNENSNQPYCTFVINPKLEKLKAKFKDKLKK